MQYLSVLVNTSTNARRASSVSWTLERIANPESKPATPESTFTSLPYWSYYSYDIETGFVLCVYASTRPSDEELDTLPQVVMTSDDPWDPSCYDCDGPQDEMPPSQPEPEETKNPEDSDELPPDPDDNLRACLHAFQNQITVYRPKS